MASAPSGLLPATRGAWAAFWNSEAAAGVDDPAKAALVLRLFGCRDRHARLVALSARRLTADEALRRLALGEALEQEAAELEAALALPSSARASLGLPSHYAALLIAAARATDPTKETRRVR